MRPGKLRHRVNLQEYSQTRDSYGAVTETWATYATIWASIEPLKARERMIAKQAAMTVTNQITIRFHKKVSARDRVQFGSRTYEVNEIINPEERNRELQLLCTEVIS